MAITENLGLNYDLQNDPLEYQKRDENWNKLAAYGPLCVLSQIPLASLPGSPSDGEKYITTDTLEIYIRQAGVWETFPLPCGMTFYDQNTSTFYKYDGSTITVLESPTSTQIYLKPMFYGIAAAGVITIPASSETPVNIKIGSTIYTQTIDATVDPSISGAGGLDTGTLAVDTVYYLYAINDSGLNYVLSANDPFTGPVGFTEYNYLGSCFSGNPAQIYNFTFRNGRYLANEGYQQTASGLITNLTLKIPDHATSVFIYGRFTDVSAGSLGDTVTAIVNNLGQDIMTCQSNTAEDENTPVFVELPFFPSSTLDIAAPNLEVAIKVIGWEEDVQSFVDQT